MIQTFIATIAFAIALLVFCNGAKLIIWAISNDNIRDVAGAKLTGYFVMVLATVTLVGTAYYISMGISSGGNNLQPMRQWTTKNMSHDSMHKPINH